MGLRTPAGPQLRTRVTRLMVFCQIRLIADQIEKINIPYQEIVKTTRYWFFWMDEKNWHGKRYLAKMRNLL